jgi:hypothetical protein
MSDGTLSTKGRAALREFKIELEHVLLDIDGVFAAVTRIVRWIAIAADYGPDYEVDFEKLGERISDQLDGQLSEPAENARWRLERPPKTLGQVLGAAL